MEAGDDVRSGEVGSYHFSPFTFFNGTISRSFCMLAKGPKCAMVHFSLNQVSNAIQTETFPYSNEMSFGYVRERGCTSDSPQLLKQKKIKSDL